jgi:hypothetical protein
MTSSRHLGDDTLERFALYEPLFGPPELGETERAHLLTCARCRRRLAELDPSALFGLLAGLPVGDALPERPALPPRRGQARTGARWLAAAAAALAALAALYGLARPPADAGIPVWAQGLHDAAPASIVRRVESPTATVVTLLPPSGRGPTVTMIFDEEFDL